MGQVINPYAPPSTEADFDPGAFGRSPADAHLASRGTRWIGAVLDQLVFVAAMLPGFLLVLVADQPNEALGIALCGLGLFVVGGVQAYLVATTGQSIAKRGLRTKIVKQDGSLPGFVHGVLLRSWLTLAIGMLPGVGSFFHLVDALMVFRADRRCLHDLIAGTIVIQLRPGVAGG
jgi:uncharacterized RDD family membrane protein YckC